MECVIPYFDKLGTDGTCPCGKINDAAPQRKT